MDDFELRLECLRLAAARANFLASQSSPSEKAEVEMAREFYAFVSGDHLSAPLKAVA